MKMLMFDYRESEKKFFEERLFQDLEIDFITSPLTSISKLSDEQLENTEILSVFISSTLTEDVLKQFKNLSYFQVTQVSLTKLHSFTTIKQKETK